MSPLPSQNRERVESHLKRYSSFYQEAIYFEDNHTSDADHAKAH